MQVEVGGNQIQNSATIFSKFVIDKYRITKQYPSTDGAYYIDKPPSHFIATILVEEAHRKKDQMHKNNSFTSPEELARTPPEHDLVHPGEFLTDMPPNSFAKSSRHWPPTMFSNNCKSTDLASVRSRNKEVKSEDKDNKAPLMIVPNEGHHRSNLSSHQEEGVDNVPNVEAIVGQDTQPLPLHNNSLGPCVTAVKKSLSRNHEIEKKTGKGDINFHGEVAVLENARPAPKLAQTKVRPGMCIRSWIIISRIGAGSFGETFTATKLPYPRITDNKYEDKIYIPDEPEALLASLPPPGERKEVCIKVEQENKNILRLEALALKKVQPCSQVVRYIGNGCVDGMNYLVMEKLGSNLTELRRRSPHGTFNIYTTLKAGISCLTAIRGVHEQGLVHRDIKPSNFVTGLPGSSERATCYLIDFGLARRYRRSSGELRPSRKNAGFRGTSRYASVASHLRLELGRVDDLWSLLFMLIEFATGTLPWRKYKDKDEIGRCKAEAIGPQLVRNLPREFQPFLAHLQTLVYEDEPDYDYLLALLYRALARRGYPPNKPVDWELDSATIEQVAEAEIRMSLHKRGDRNKNTTDRHSRNGLLRENTREATQNLANVHRSGLLSLRTAPKFCEMVPIRPQENFHTSPNVGVGDRPNELAHASQTPGKIRQMELVTAKEMADHKEIRISKVEHPAQRSVGSNDTASLDRPGAPGHFASTDILMERNDDIQPPKELKHSKSDNKVSEILNHNERVFSREAASLPSRDNAVGCTVMHTNENDFSSRECSRISNKLSFSGTKIRKSFHERASDKLPKVGLVGLSNHTNSLCFPADLDLPVHQKKHIDAIQQTLSDTKDPTPLELPKESSDVKRKQVIKCKCIVM